MKERLVFTVWCSAAGAVIVLALLVRSGNNSSPASSQPPPSPQTFDVQPVPLPPPPSLAVATPQNHLEQDLAKQQELTKDLRDELQKQQDVADDLKAQLERQQEETDKVLEQLRAYQNSVQGMADQQARLIESIPQQNQTQTMLLWGIVGLFMLLMLGGGAALVIFAVWLMQIQRQSQRPAVMYPVHLSPNSYPYYERRPLPPPSSRQQFIEYDVQPFED